MTLEMQDILDQSLIHILIKDPDEEWSSIVYNWPMLSSPIPTAIACIAFIIAVKFIGPNIMNTRQPFNVKPVIILYNFVMVGVNLWMFFQFGKLGWFGSYSFKCQPFDASPKGMPMNRVSYVYFLTKFVDWMDTIFFVLTKKFSHITWLHLIHHSSMPIYSYMGMRLAPNGHATVSCMLNSLVHVIMYTYYGLACCGDRVKPFLWWKKYITQMQLLQFFLIFLHMCNAFFREDCKYPPHPFYIMSVLLISFSILFVNFYIQQYMRPKKSKEDKKTIMSSYILSSTDVNGNVLQHRKTFTNSSQ